MVFNDFGPGKWVPEWKTTNCDHVEVDFESCHSLGRLRDSKVQRNGGRNLQKVLSTSFREKIAKIAFEIAKCRQIDYDEV